MIPEECKKFGGHCYGPLNISSNQHGEYDWKQCKHCAHKLTREWRES